MGEIHQVALFRYSVLGALVSRGHLARGELKATIRELAAREYDVPGSRNSRLSEKTIEAWYYKNVRVGSRNLTLLVARLPPSVGFATPRATEHATMTVRAASSSSPLLPPTVHQSSAAF